MEMMSGSSFEFRLADMNNGSTPRSRKRPIYSTYSTPTETARHGPDNELLGHTDKRMRSILNKTRTDLFPPSAKPVMQQVTHFYESPVMQQANDYYENPYDYLSPIRRPKFSPHTFSSAVRSRPKPAMKALASPLVLGKAEKIYSEWQVVQHERLYRESQVVQQARAYRESQVAPRTVFFSSSLGYDWGSNARHSEKQREIEALRRENEDLRSLVAREGWERARAKELVWREDVERPRAKELVWREDVERSRAKDLKQAVELEKFKRLVSANSKLRDAGLSPAFQSDRGTNGTDGYTVSRVENLSRDVVVVSAGSSGSLSDDENVASSSGGRETDQEPAWRALFNKARDPRNIPSLQKEIDYTALRLRALQLGRPAKLKAEKKPEEDKTLVGAFTPLSDEAELAVDEALDFGDRYEILVTHDKSNIEVTRVIIQCLSPGVWLNDEVINVYMDLLKERETREPDRFLKCHFFNTFFYNKLFKDKRSYDYKAIRRWTTQKKLGYSLSDCDKILVPIHQDIHWCLAVINIRDKQLEYLDSLKGGDHSVLDVLARYIADEAKDKDGKVLDVSTWQHDFPKDIPEQLNGCDCGVFMVKYADFHSRGAPLQFSQDDMDYFRRKMVWEILDLTAT